MITLSNVGSEIKTRTKGVITEVPGLGGKRYTQKKKLMDPQLGLKSERGDSEGSCLGTWGCGGGPSEARKKELSCLLANHRLRERWRRGRKKCRKICVWKEHSQGGQLVPRRLG